MWHMENYKPALLCNDRMCVICAPCHACFTLADSTPRSTSDVVGGKSGQSHPTSNRDPIHIGQMAHNAYIGVGWYGEGVLFITTTSERQLHCTRSAPDGLLMRPRQLMPGREPIHIGQADSIGASDRLM